MNESSSIGIIGSGSWATAVAKILMNNVYELNWYFRNPKHIKMFRKFNHNPNYLTSVDFDTDKINFYSEVDQLVENSDIIIIAVPSAFIKGTLGALSVPLKDKFVVSAMKGLVPDENMVLGQYMKEYYDLPEGNFAAIVGPCHAEEIALERLSYLTVACQDTNQGREFANLLMTPFTRSNVIDDVYGAEYAAVLKNIMAIASGICHGMGYGDNMQAVLISNAIQEIKRFVDTVHPCNRDILCSAYLGDLLVTGYSQFSRNRMFGNMIGKGYSVKYVLMEMLMVAEGYYAAKSIHEINEKYKVNMPITDAVYNIIYERISPSIELTLLIEHLR